MADVPDQARLTRRGIQIFRLAMAMEAGDEEGGNGAEALFYLIDAIARIAALSTKPRLAIEVVVGLIDKIDSAWLEANHARPKPDDDLFANLALEVGLGPDHQDEVPVGEPAVRALSCLIDGLVHVAALNGNPRQILERVVQRLDETDIDAVRKEQLR